MQYAWTSAIKPRWNERLSNQPAPRRMRPAAPPFNPHRRNPPHPTTTPRTVLPLNRKPFDRPVWALARHAKRTKNRHDPVRFRGGGPSLRPNHKAGLTADAPRFRRTFEHPTSNSVREIRSDAR